MTIKIALLGLGTVGSGILDIIKNDNGKIEQTSGQKIVVKKALVRNKEKYQKFAHSVNIITDFNDILSDPEIGIVAELMGGLHPAKEYISEALRAGKNVVTANKDLMAAFGTELIKLAQDNRCDLMYDASVAGGIPILRTLSDSYVGDHILEIQGIVNGTTNYILSQMNKKGLSYETALKHAQELGFAEADPTNDVTGKDAAYKMILLCQFAFGAHVKITDFNVEGIDHLQDFDLQQAKELGYPIKLIGIAKKVADKLFVEVAPCLLLADSLMANIENEINALQIKSRNLGTALLTGPGAGSLATANSVMNDIVSEVKNLVNKTNGQLFNRFSSKDSLIITKDIKNPYYLSFKQEKVAHLTNILDELGIEIQELKQIEDRTIVITKAINQLQLEKLSAANVKLMAKYKIL